jgi:phospholipid transport system transporter-binding protein
VSVVTLPASLTLKDVSTVLQAVEAGLADGSALQIDASALTELDTSAVALMMQARRLAAARGVAFELKSPPAKLVTLAQLYGVESLLSLE